MKRARTTKRSTLSTKVAADGKPETVVVPALVPRNPFVAHAHRRKGGAHGESGRSRRQTEKRELKKLLGE